MKNATTTNHLQRAMTTTNIPTGILTFISSSPDRYTAANRVRDDLSGKLFDVCVSPSKGWGMEGSYSVWTKTEDGEWAEDFGPYRTAEIAMREAQRIYSTETVTVASPR